MLPEVTSTRALFVTRHPECGETSLGSHTNPKHFIYRFMIKSSNLIRHTLAVLRDQSLKIRVLPLSKVLIPVAEIIMDAKGRCVGGRRRRSGRGVRVGQPVGAPGVERCAGPRGASAAPQRHLPVRGVGLGPGLEDLKRFASVRSRHRPSTVEQVSRLRGAPRTEYGKRTSSTDLTP